MNARLIVALTLLAVSPLHLAADEKKRSDGSIRVRKGRRAAAEWR